MYSRVFIKSTIRAFVSAHLSAVNGDNKGQWDVITVTD